jgi:site-specific recombinase XerD
LSQLKENVNYLPNEKFDLILLYVTNNLKSKKLKSIDIQMIFKIAYHAGLRINEVLKLSKSSFNFDLLQINLGKTKTKTHDLATFPNSFSLELQDYLFNDRSLILKSDLLFPISRQTVYTWIMQIGLALEIPAWTTPQTESGEKTKTHLFRKSIAKNMLYKKAPLNVIMNKLRHTNLATTSDYLKLNLSDVQTWENENL